MSAPRTPAEMADWLTYRLGDQRPSDEAALREILAWLRRQPTDAQKIEALELVSDAALFGLDVWQNKQANWTLGYVSDGLAASAWSKARKALRLLGLPTGDETP